MIFQGRMLTPFNPISRLGKIKTNFYEVMTIFISSFISNGSDWWLDSHGAGPVKIDIDFGMYLWQSCDPGSFYLRAVNYLCISFHAQCPSTGDYTCHVDLSRFVTCHECQFGPILTHECWGDWRPEGFISSPIWNVALLWMDFSCRHYHQMAISRMILHI